uniref:Uncharacterized protein n=1 Tax=Oryza rufipogon TaxID=4529 RepID=A0A0E0R156_ORYRU
MVAVWHSLRCSIPPSRPPPTAMATSPPRPLHRLPSDGGARSRTGEHRQGGSSLKTPPSLPPTAQREARATGIYGSFSFDQNPYCNGCSTHPSLRFSRESTDGGRGKGEVTYEHTREAVRSLDQEKGLFDLDKFQVSY